MQQTLTPELRVDRLVVALDANGDVRSLEAAVRVAAPGATLLLRAGTHRLSRPLRIDQPLSLVGDGRESTYVVCASPGCVVQVGGNGRFAASDVTFIHEGAQVANVIEVACGEIDLRRYRFLGGVYDESTESGGTGLVLRGQVQGTVAECKASGNGYDGIDGTVCRARRPDQSRAPLCAHGIEEPVHEGVGGQAFGLAFKVEQHAVAQHRMGERLHVLHGGVVAALQ